MSNTNENSNYGKPWTTVGTYQDFASAAATRDKVSNHGNQTKIHKQENGFAVKVRSVPQDLDTDAGEDVAPAKKQKAKKA